MAWSDLVGFMGVGLILLAYFMQLNGYWKSESWVYLLTNFFGAGLACASSVLIGSWPFTILEGTWCAVSVAGMVRLLRSEG